MRDSGEQYNPEHCEVQEVSDFGFNDARFAHPVPCCGAWAGCSNTTLTTRSSACIGSPIMPMLCHLQQLPASPEIRRPRRICLVFPSSDCFGRVLVWICCFCSFRVSSQRPPG